MAGKRRRDLEYMVLLMQVLVDDLMVQTAVYPVDTHVSKEQETSNAQEHPRSAQRRGVDVVIKFAVSLDL